VLASPQISQPLRSRRSWRSPARTTSWSSAIRMRTDRLRVKV